MLVFFSPSSCQVWMEGHVKTEKSAATVLKSADQTPTLPLPPFWTSRVYHCAKTCFCFYTTLFVAFYDGKLNNASTWGLQKFFSAHHRSLNNKQCYFRFLFKDNDRSGPVFAKWRYKGNGGATEAGWEHHQHTRSEKQWEMWQYFKVEKNVPGLALLISRLRWRGWGWPEMNLLGFWNKRPPSGWLLGM